MFQGTISTYLNHDRSFVSLPRVEVNFLAPLESAGSLCLFLSFFSACLCQNSTSIVRPLPFHKVSGATGSGKDKINHFIWEKAGRGGGR